MFKQFKIIISFLLLSFTTPTINPGLLKHILPNILIAGQTITKRKPFFEKEKDYSKWISQKTNYKNTAKPTITWIGHSTFLIQIGGLNILTDPVFYDLSPIIYKRQMPLGIELKDLPKIDVILISHKHKDHFHAKSLLSLKKYNPIILTPKGTGKWFHKKKFKKIFELNWNNTKTIKDVQLTFLPAKHWSGTNLFNVDKSISGSFMIQANDITIYFAGDSAYDSHFKNIGKRFKKIDIALLPIAPTKPKQTKKHHIDSREATQAFLDLNAKKFIPMHWGTFPLGTDTFISPVNKLYDCIKNRSEELKGKSVIIPKFGQKITI